MEKLMKIAHIAGIVAAYLAAAVFLIAGILDLGAGGGVAQGRLITWGITAALASTVAVLEGAKALPSVGMWKVGAKFSGLSDLAFIIITAILIIGIGISLAF